MHEYRYDLVVKYLFNRDIPPEEILKCRENVLNFYKLLVTKPESWHARIVGDLIAAAGFLLPEEELIIRCTRTDDTFEIEYGPPIGPSRQRQVYAPLASAYLVLLAASRERLGQASTHRTPASTGPGLTSPASSPV